MEDHKEGAQNLERGLKPRHVEMIALGGTIGVGLFMGSAKYDSDGRAVGPHLLRRYGRLSCSLSCVSWVKCSIRNRSPALLQPTVISISALYRLPYGLFLLVLVGRRRPFGSHSRRHLRPLLVPLAASMDIGPGRDGRRRHCQHGSRQVLRGI